jgi:hypothetical protein
MTIRQRAARAFLAFAIATLVLSWATATYAQQRKTDLEEIEALVNDYTRLEDAGDMATQARMMATDRWWHGIGGRRTDNVQWMKVQDESLAASRKRYPGLQTVREVRDLKVRVIAPTVAVASFTWFANRIVPPDLPADKVTALGPAPIPVVYSLVWVRQSEGWRIVSSHNSPLYLR